MSKENLLLTEEEIVTISGEAYRNAIREGDMAFRAEYKARKAVARAQHGKNFDELKRIYTNKGWLRRDIADLIGRMEQE